MQQQKKKPTHDKPSPTPGQYEPQIHKWCGQMRDWGKELDVWLEKNVPHQPLLWTPPPDPPPYPPPKRKS